MSEARENLSVVPVGGFSLLTKFTPENWEIDCFLARFSPERRCFHGAGRICVLRVDSDANLPDMPPGSVIYIEAGRKPECDELTLAGFISGGCVLGRSRIDGECATFSQPFGDRVYVCRTEELRWRYPVIRIELGLFA